MKKFRQYAATFLLIAGTFSTSTVMPMQRASRYIFSAAALLTCKARNVDRLEGRSDTMNPSRNSAAAATEDVCHYVLHMSKLPLDPTAPPIHHTFTALDTFFKKIHVKDYTDAAQFGRENRIFDDPNAFNKKMGAFFVKNSTDVIPEGPRKYQAIIFATSGIDVFMERLAFLSRLTKSHNIEANEIVALVGNHAHRKDLQNIDYLMDLPHLFASDFELTTFDTDKAQKSIEPLTAQKDWTHRDGMEVAWKLVECDTTMKNLKPKFRYFSGDGNPSLRTEQLLEQLIARGLPRPITSENPIAFIVNAQGSAKTKEMIKKYFSDNAAVDILIARPVADEIEERLFNDTPQQRAMTKLFHFYRILETLAQAQTEGAQSTFIVTRNTHPSAHRYYWVS